MPTKYGATPNSFAVAFAILICGFSTAIATQNVRLTWVESASPDVTGYNVYYGTESGIYSAMISAGGSTTVSVDDLAEGQTYYFTVTAYDSAGAESAPSNEASYSVSGIAPPQGPPFVAQILPYNSIALAWNPSPTANVQGYYVRYGTQSGIYDNVVWVASDAQLDIYYLADGTTYFFSVTAVDSSGTESGATPEFSYSIPQVVPPQNAPTLQPVQSYDAVRLTWDPSPSADVAGYRVYYGTQYGVYDNWIDVGNAEATQIWGLVEGKSYFFAVTAYSVFSQESAWSAETWYYLEPVVVDPGVVLGLQQIPIPGFPNAFSITATGVLPASWTVESSSDLKTWHTLATGTESEMNVTVVVSEKPGLFFRLHSWYEGIELDTESDGTNRYPNSFVVTTPYEIPWDWTLESSEDLQNWSPLVAGFDSSVKVAIVSTPTPSLYFRLKGD